MRTIFRQVCQGFRDIEQYPWNFWGKERIKRSNSTSSANLRLVFTYPPKITNNGSQWQINIPFSAKLAKAKPAYSWTSADEEPNCISNGMRAPDCATFLWYFSVEIEYKKTYTYKYVEGGDIGEKKYTIFC